MADTAKTVRIEPGSTLRFARETRDGKTHVTLNLGDEINLEFPDGATLTRLATLVQTARESLKMAPRAPMIHSRPGQPQDEIIR